MQSVIRNVSLGDLWLLDWKVVECGDVEEDVLPAVKRGRAADVSGMVQG